VKAAAPESGQVACGRSSGGEGVGKGEAESQSFDTSHAQHGNSLADGRDFARQPVVGTVDDTENPTTEGNIAGDDTCDFLQVDVLLARKAQHLQRDGWNGG